MKNLAELHGGSVRVKSGGDGKGTTFIVSLPVSVVHTLDIRPNLLYTKVPYDERLLHTPELYGIKVMVVDDEVDATRLVKRILEDAGARVMACTSMTECLNSVPRLRPHVIIMDIGMPEMDGYTLVGKLRALGRDEGGRTGAVALTAFAPSENRRQAMLAGFDIHVAKPVEPGELVAVVSRLGAQGLNDSEFSGAGASPDARQSNGLSPLENPYNYGRSFRGYMPEAKRIGILLHPVRTYCRRVLRGIATVGSRARWEWLLVSADVNPLLDTLSQDFLDGVIGHFADKSLLSQVVQAKLPAVDIAPLDRDGELVRVTTDEVAVGRLAAAHLLSLGLPHFAFFGTQRHYYSMLREQGFRESIEAAGLSCHVMLDGTDADSPDGPNGRQLESWIRALPKPIGVMASTDSRALQLLAVCRKLQLPVPKSVAVLGVDNDDVFCETSNPPLTSIALSTHRIGYEAARMLEELMLGKKIDQRHLLIPPAGVVPRQSSDLPALLDPDVAAAVRFISLHAQDDLQVADVLREIPLSRTSLEQRFRKVLGRTPAAEIRRAQVELAKTILTQTDESMSQVARAAGFSNAKQLGTTFHRETGMTPSAYRRASRSKPQ